MILISCYLSSPTYEKYVSINDYEQKIDISQFFVLNYCKKIKIWNDYECNTDYWNCVSAK